MADQRSKESLFTRDGRWSRKSLFTRDDGRWLVDAIRRACLVGLLGEGVRRGWGVLEMQANNSKKLGNIKMAPKMARKRKLTFSANVDMVSGEPRRWYIDIYNVQGNKLPRPHVLICNLEDCMVSNKEDTMFSRGWNIEANDAANFTCEVLQLAMSEIQQWKPPKAGGKSELTPKKPRKRVSTGLDTIEAEAGPSNLGLPNSKRLVKMAKKAKDSPLGGISQYVDFFPLILYREFEIPTAKCFLAPEHIICRSMSEDKLEIILGWFTSKANNPASCAYLMPIDWVQEHKAIPKKKDQVKVEDIQNYDYWIIDGQHSISCAKMLVTTNDLDEGLVHLNDVYRYQKARIIVDAPTQKQSHMVACPDDILETWCAIIDDVEKGVGEKRKTDMPEYVMQTNMLEYIMQTKQDKVIQEALALEFNAANPSKKFQDWEETTTFYGMSENIYGMLQKKCDAWVKSKLQVGKSNLEFPSDVQMYIQWIVNISVAKDITKDLPWHIPVVSLAMEGELFLARLFPNPMPIGLCILDNTEGSAREMQWSTERFSHFLSGILTITGGTKNPQCVLLAFVRIFDLMRLKDALRSVSGSHKMFFGAIHFMRDAPCRGAIPLFSVLIYLSKGERFDGYGSFSSAEGPILDESRLDIEYEIVRPMDPRAYLREKKTMLINRCINLYCTKGLMVIDAYSNGFVSWCALKERREVMGLVESIKEREELHSELLSFATSNRQVKEWANIVEDLQRAVQDQQQAIESSTSETQLVLENKTPPSKPFDPRGLITKYLQKERTSI
ncbi:hypothetical protein L7F22_039659 [Adiantum nelumboides]|nr:hypothetical protein [Adiantum nelumboides]